MSFGTLTRYLVITVGLMIGVAGPSQAGPILYDSGTGLTATADFHVAGITLAVLLANTSVVPFSGQNGSANMILSSLSFDLPSGVSVLGGSAVLGPGSTVVRSTTGSAWASFGGPVDLNLQYGFSNTGVGNSGGGAILGATHAMTSHNNGGNRVIAFGGGGIANNGLEWGLVPFNSLDNGNGKAFVQNSALLTLQLSAPLADTSFLANGSYVEFGSDYLYVPGTELTPVPEPTSLALVGSGALLLAARMRKRRRQQSSGDTMGV